MSKYQYPSIFALILFITSPLFAQHNLTGKVIDPQQVPVAFANVVLLDAVDSTSVIKGAVSSEEGVFNFEGLPAESFLLRVSFVGFKDHLQEISVTEYMNIGTIVLEESYDALDEVSIRVKSPTISKRVDRLVFEVENSSLSSGSSWDILSKTPMVVVSDDKLQVRNQRVEVYINDKKVHLSEVELKTLLENYSAENIKSVEVITNPPSRYDAEGGSILNIVTTRSISPGYKGSVNGSYTQSIFPKFNLGTSHYFKSDKLNLFANYSYSPKKIFKEDESYINFIEGGRMTEHWETDFNRTTRSESHSANVMLDYAIDDRNSLSFSSNAVFSPYSISRNNALTNIQDEHGASQKLQTKSWISDEQVNVGLTLDYKRQLGNNGATFTAKAHYTYYEQDRIQDMMTQYLGIGPGVELQPGNLNSEENQGIDILTGQFDYSAPLGGSQFEMGVKASSISSESAAIHINRNDIGMPVPWDNFIYDENIYAGYASIAKDWERWSLKGGFRGEFTDRQGESVSMTQDDNKEHFDLFPTVYVMHTPNANHSFSIDYSRRIQRPRYQSLNPFRYYISYFNFNEGNPDLRAAISDNFNLNYTFKGQYFFDLYYRDNGPRPEVVSFQDNDLKNKRNVSVNMLESLSYGLDITHGRSIAPWWYAYTYMSFFHEEQTFLALESGNVPETNEIDAFYGMLSNSFTLSKDGTFTGDLLLIYVSDWITGSYNLDPMTTLSLGFRKTLWNNRAELSLNFEDILNQTNTRMTSKYLNQDNSFFAHPESRYVRVGFKYNFGNFRLRDNQRSIDAAERDRI